MSKLTFYILISSIFFVIAPTKQLEIHHDRLSPIQVESPEIKSEVPSSKESENSLKNILKRLKGKVVETKFQEKMPAHEERVEYDSLDEIQYIDDENHHVPLIRGKKNIKQWDHWGKWSQCSVTCGVGKMTRWRHCMSQGCAPGEKEAQIKTCTMKSCP